jgi:hypothetical protein
VYSCQAFCQLKNELAAATNAISHDSVEATHGLSASGTI